MAKFKHIRHNLSGKLELPEDALGTAYRLQLIGDSAILCGCRKLLKYTSEEVVALTKEAAVSFIGMHLKCVYFFEGTVEICGDIRQIGIEKR